MGMVTHCPTNALQAHINQNIILIFALTSIAIKKIFNLSPCMVPHKTAALAIRLLKQVHMHALSYAHTTWKRQHTNPHHQHVCLFNETHKKCSIFLHSQQLFQFPITNHIRTTFKHLQQWHKSSFFSNCNAGNQNIFFFYILLCILEPQCIFAGTSSFAQVHETSLVSSLSLQQRFSSDCKFSILG